MDQGTVSGKGLKSSLITLAIIFFFVLKIASGLKIFGATRPRGTVSGKS